MTRRMPFPLRVVCALTLVATLACEKRESEARAASPSDAPSPPSALPVLTLGIQSSPAMALVMVAEDKHLFDQAGVDVELKEFTAGKFALQAFLGGSLDAAVSGEVPVALSILQGNKFRVLAQVVERTVNEVRVVARRDGASDADAYFRSRKRKLATSFGGGPEFFTYQFLRKHGIALTQVELISQRPEDMPAALVSGTVDAISVFDPFAHIAERDMAEKGVTYTAGDTYSELYVISTMDETIQQRSAELAALIRGLWMASTYVKEAPAEAKQIVARYTKLTPDVIDAIWSSFVFVPALTPLLTEYTTAEAKWAIEKGTFPAGTPIPDFEAVLYPELLSKIAPEAVSISK